MTLTLFTRSSMGLDLGLIRPDVKSLQQTDPFCYAIAVLSQISSRSVLLFYATSTGRQLIHIHDTQASHEPVLAMDRNSKTFP